MTRMFGVALVTCSGPPGQWKMVGVIWLECWMLPVAGSSPVWWYKLVPRFPLLCHQRGTCALPLQKQIRSHDGWGQRRGSGSTVPQASFIHCLNSERSQEYSQIVSFSNLANVLLRSFPMRLQRSISENIMGKGRREPIPTFARAQPILAFTAKATKGKPTSPQTRYHPTT